MSSHTITMSDLGKALITRGFDTSDKLLKIWLTLIIDSTKSKVIEMLVFSVK